MEMNLDFAAFGIWYLVFLFSTTVHEAAHAWIATRGGDRTAFEGGHLTLDPMVHIRRSPFGMVLVPVITFFRMGFLMGWASVPFDPRWGKRYPRRQALMSLAGPASNFLLAGIGVVVAVILAKMGVVRIPVRGDFTTLVVPADPQGVQSALGAVALGTSVLVNLNILLGVFNLLPVPPLDGAGVAEGLFPNSLGRLYDQVRESFLLQLLAFVIAWEAIPYLAGPALRMAAEVVALAG